MPRCYTDLNRMYDPAEVPTPPNYRSDNKEE